jgi:hypothetical protein
MDTPATADPGISKEVSRALALESRKAGLAMGSERNLSNRLTQLQTAGTQQVKAVADGLRAIPANDLAIKGLTSIEEQVGKIFQAVSGLASLQAQPVTVNPTINNTFSNANEAALLKQVRKQTLGQIADIVGAAIN